MICAHLAGAVFRQRPLKSKGAQMSHLSLLPSSQSPPTTSDLIYLEKGNVEGAEMLTIFKGKKRLHNNER